MTTGERIKQRRKRLGMSAETLATKVGVSPATIYRWEKGDIEKVPGSTLEPLSDALQTTPAYLMGWTEKEDATSIEQITSVSTIEVQHPETRILAKGFDQMPEEARKRALAMARMIFVEYADLFDEKGATQHDDP